MEGVGRERIGGGRRKRERRGGQDRAEEEDVDSFSESSLVLTETFK